MDKNGLLEKVIRYATVDPQALADAVASSHRQILSALRDEIDDEDIIEVESVRVSQAALAQRNRGIQSTLQTSEAIVAALLVLCSEQQGMLMDREEMIRKLERELSEKETTSKETSEEMEQSSEETNGSIPETMETKEETRHF